MYRLVNTDTLETRSVDLPGAARTMKLDPDEIEWALEEYGRCDGELYALLPEGVEYTPYQDE